MFVRLTVMTAIVALFAFGFSSLVAMERPAAGPIGASADCRDGGLVCTPRGSRAGL